MTDIHRAKTPLPHPDAKPPETHHQTRKLEQRLPPTRNTTEPYGKGSQEPANQAESTGRTPRPQK